LIQHELVTYDIVNSGATYFLGGLLAILSAIGEFLLGNSFSMILFGVYGGFFLAYGATLQPTFNAYIAYDPTDPTGAVMSPGFLSSIGM
jgi:succinate-acetate transporter protein